MHFHCLIRVRDGGRLGRERWIKIHVHVRVCARGVYVMMASLKIESYDQ
jgi:hypothetical protein